MFNVRCFFVIHFGLIIYILNVRVSTLNTNNRPTNLKQTKLQADFFNGILLIVFAFNSNNCKKLSLMVFFLLKKKVNTDIYLVT